MSMLDHSTGCRKSRLAPNPRRIPRVLSARRLGNLATPSCCSNHIRQILLGSPASRIRLASFPAYRQRLDRHQFLYRLTANQRRRCGQSGHPQRPPLQLRLSSRPQRPGRCSWRRCSLQRNAMWKQLGQFVSAGATTSKYCSLPRPRPVCAVIGPSTRLRCLTAPSLGTTHSGRSSRARRLAAREVPLISAEVSSKSPMPKAICSSKTSLTPFGCF
mmetsp:Transcript_21540/g.61664  ORF Transcript_21540/g.61664 Transcript_21540/m.61664 type:complete len:216 (+) Transcript_21540:170-817(+)